MMRKTSLYSGEFSIDRTPVDARERQTSLTLRFAGQLLHESWSPQAGPISHGAATESAEITMVFHGSLVQNTDDAARALRALANKLETVK